MKAEEIRVGDIVEIDYIEEFTKEHINEGKALVICKSNNQPLVRKLNTKSTTWSCYKYIKRVIGHTNIEGYMDYVLNTTYVESRESSLEKREPCINCEDGCEEWAGCPCMHYRAESEEE